MPSMNKRKCEWGETNPAKKQKIETETYKLESADGKQSIGKC